MKLIITLVNADGNPAPQFKATVTAQLKLFPEFATGKVVRLNQPKNQQNIQTAG